MILNIPDYTLKLMQGDKQVWEEINGPNLRQNIAPTRDRATAILVKGESHSVDSILIRKV